MLAKQVACRLVSHERFLMKHLLCFVQLLTLCWPEPYCPFLPQRAASQTVDYARTPPLSGLMWAWLLLDSQEFPD